ncbi:MAG: hypothetical protein IPP65_12980 [Chlorobi bacterium]|nr:hypothetical protein [Chlorobiota bacterium]
MTSVSFDSSINNIYNNSAVLVLGGNLPSKKCIEIHINLSHEFVAADSGIIKLLKKNLIPKYVIGDLDSIVGNESKLIEKKIILVKFKSNFTNDFEKTLNWLKKRNYKMITLFGVRGGDSDHTLNNFSIISKYSSSLKF